MPERGLLIFLQFFRNFLAQVKYERNLGFKFFSLFLGLSNLVLAKNNARKTFLNFWIFFFFLEFSCPGRVWRNSWLKFISLFLGQYYPVLAKNIAGKSFFNFLNFLIFFSEFPCTGRVWTEFRSKFFFSLSRSILSHFR